MSDMFCSVKEERIEYEVQMERNGHFGHAGL